MVVAERKAKGVLGCPVSHPEHGDIPMQEFLMLAYFAVHFSTGVTGSLRMLQGRVDFGMSVRQNAYTRSPRLRRRFEVVKLKRTPR